MNNEIYHRITIPNLGGYSISEDKKVYSPIGQKYVVYLPGGEVKIWVFGAWRIYKIEDLYKQAWQ